jgi:sec-independent protein translocase protein TatA
MEVALIFLVVLLVFGAKRIPEIARGLGKGIREFKTATREISNEFNVDERSNRIQAPPPPMQAPTPREPAQTAAPHTPTSTDA